MVVDIDGEIHKLTGSAEAQYAQWRDLMQKIYESETGLAPQIAAEIKTEVENTTIPVATPPDTQP